VSENLTGGGYIGRIARSIPTYAISAHYFRFYKASCSWCNFFATFQFKKFLQIIHNPWKENFIKADSTNGSKNLWMKTRAACERERERERNLYIYIKLLYIKFIYKIYIKTLYI